MIFRILVSLALGVFLNSCATSTLNVTNDTILRANEGLVGTVIHTNVPKYTLTLKQKDARSGTAAVYNGEDPQKLVLATLPAQDYAFGMFYQVGSVLINRTAFFPDSFTFTLVQGKITYVGDLHLNGEKGKLLIRVVDNFDEFKQKLTERYPELIKRYPLINATKEREEAIPFE